MKNRYVQFFIISHFVLFAALLLISPQLKGQNTLIYGKAVDYSSREITFYTLSDPILKQKSELATTTVVANGSFSALITPGKTIEIYADLERYCGSMVIEPGKNYQVSLPPYSPRSQAEANSAYFKPTPYWLGLPGTGNTDLNFAVRSFLSDYNLEMVKNTTQIYQQKSKEIANEIMDRLEKKYATFQNPYFMTLRKYTFAELEYIVNQKNTEFIVKKYFATQTCELNNPGYQRAFEILFTDFLRKQSQDIKNQKITDLVNQGKYNELVTFFEERGFKKELAELAVLKGLYDGYYSGNFTKAGIIRTLEIAQSDAASSEHQTIANQIRRSLTFLAIGGKAPSFRLSDINGELITMDQFKGKYVLLSFINSSSSDSRREIEAMVPLERRLRQVLSIVTVALDENYERATSLWKTKHYSWELLNGAGQKQLIKNYNASITPAFYLIAPDGTMRLSQAPFPTHDFETIFLKIIRDNNNINSKPKPSKPNKAR